MCAVVINMSYKPAVIGLLALAQTVGENWAVVRGLDVLLQQEYVQFAQWTGRACPKGVVAERASTYM